MVPDDRTLDPKSIANEHRKMFELFHYPDKVKESNVLFFALPSYWGSFPWRAKFISPVWYDEKHRIVPTFPSVAVSVDGEVVDVRTGKIKHPWKEKYWVVNVYSYAERKNKHIQLHVLVANAWVSYRQDSIHFVCNHKDGNKFNPSASNLEWVTYAENMHHALVSGLLIEARPCKLRHKTTGEILEFPSVKQAALYLQRKPEHLYNESNSLNHLFNGSYELRIAGDKRPWLYCSKHKVMNDLTARYIIEVRENERTIKKFNGAQAFGEYYCLKTTPNPLTLKTYLNRFKHKYPTYDVKVIDQQPARKIEVKDENTGEISTYSSVRELCGKLNEIPGTIRYHLRFSGRLLLRGRRYRFKSSDPWPNTKSKFTPK